MTNKGRNEHAEHCGVVSVQVESYYPTLVFQMKKHQWEFSLCFSVKLEDEALVI